MNGKTARALRKAKREAVQESAAQVFTPLETLTRYVRSLEQRVEALEVTSRTEVEAKAQA